MPKNIFLQNKIKNAVPVNISKYIVCTLNETTNSFIVDKDTLENYLMGTALLICKVSTEQIMYMTELDNVLDFKEYSETQMYVSFDCKIERYLFPIGEQLPAMLFPVLKRFHWSWLYAMDKYLFSDEFRELNKLLNVTARLHYNVIPKKELVYNAFTNFDFFKTKVVVIGQD